jgi:hypothetical protein
MKSASPHYQHRWFRVLYAPLDDGVTCTSIEITEQKEQAKVNGGKKQGAGAKQP